MSEYYGKGITVASGFDLGAKAPLDSRSVVNTIAERDAHVTNNRAYEGMIVYVIEDKKTYQYTGTEWKELVGSGSGGNTSEETPSYGNANIHIGDEAPSDTSYLWIDTSAPNNLEEFDYKERIKLKYIEMLNNVITKLNNTENQFYLVENEINKISSANAVKASEFRVTLATMRQTLSNLKTRINSTITNIRNNGDIEALKLTARELREEMKSLLFGLSDFGDEIMRLLDSEISVDLEVGVTDSSTLLTESGLIILTESGLPLLADGIASSIILVDAILTELGEVLLTEDGKQLLKG